MRTCYDYPAIQFVLNWLPTMRQDVKQTTELAAVPSTHKLLAIVFALSAIARPALAGELTVSTDFSGGSARVMRIHQQKRHVTIRPGGDPQFGWPCWWYFQLKGIEVGETVSVEVEAVDLKRASGKRLGSDWALPSQAAYSLDQKTWKQTPPASPVDGRCVWKLKVDSPTAWFAWGPPFVPKDAQRLVATLAKSSRHATSFELCRTRAGRTVPALTVTEGGQDDGSRMVVWIQARQHAWEAGGSWVGRGFAEWLTSGDARAEALRRRVVVYYVPIMDVDNAATGNGGKEQVPNDHNRDWYAEAHWNSVKAAMSMLSAFDKQNRLVLFVDLHNPGGNSKQPFFFVAPPDLFTPKRFACQQRFVAACRKEIVEQLRLDDRLPATGPGYDPRWKRIAANWIKFNTQEHVVGTTLETCWNTPHSNTAGYMTVGKQLGQGIERYLRHDPRTVVSKSQ